MSELQKQFYKFIREAQDVDDNTLKSFIEKVDSKHIKGVLAVKSELETIEKNSLLSFSMHQKMAYK